MLPKFGKGQGSRRACHAQMLPLRTFLDALQLLVVKYVVNLIFKASTKTSLKAANLGLTSIDLNQTSINLDPTSENPSATEIG
jgi:hypothetical protein